jgi:uncharacterized protein involved in exopolysaccharide biosynthesis
MTSRLHPVPASDTIEVAEVVRTIRVGWRAVAAFTALGIVAAAGVLAFAPRIFQGESSVLVRAGNESGAGLLARIGGNVGELLGGGGALGLPKSALETELQVLNSRNVAGRVLDSLQLQLRVVSPRGVPVTTLVESSAIPGAFAPTTVDFERIAPGKYRVTGAGFTGELTQGVSGAVPRGTVTLAGGTLPESFTLKLYDREEAITRMQKRLDIGKAGGEVARVSFKADDSVTAAAVPNAIVAVYLDRRKTIDRGTNQKRVEFLAEETARTAAELTAAERSLREYQEKSGVLDATVVGRVGLESLAELRKALIEVQVEEGSINRLLAGVAVGRVTGRDLIASPAFLRGASFNMLSGQLGELEAERLKLLERRTENDPEVIALTESIRKIEGSFIPMAQSYASALAQQRADLKAQVDSMSHALTTLPAAAEAGGRRQRDVIRLSGIYAAMQAQLVEARLAAIDEGGNVRQLDTAVPPRKVWFPRPLLTLAGGAAGGLLAGLIGALILSWFGRWVRDPLEMERATGIPTTRLQSNVPLLLGPGQLTTRTLLIVPVEERARAAGALVSERLISTARNRSISATNLDLTNGNHAGSDVGVSGLIEDLERQYGLVVVQLPGLTSDAAVAALRESRAVLLVAPPDRVNRTSLIEAVETLRRLQIPCAGIVVGDAMSPVT